MPRWERGRERDDGVTDGEAFGVDEPFGDGTASDAFRLRTGRTVRRGLVHLGLAGLVSKNAGFCSTPRSARWAMRSREPASAVP